MTWGEYTYNIGVAEYRKNFSDTDSVSLRYTIEQDYAPDDPVTSVSNDLKINSGEMVIDTTRHRETSWTFLQGYETINMTVTFETTF
jgi:hypothetical protein